MYLFSVLGVIVVSAFFLITGGPWPGSGKIYWFIDFASLVPLILFNVPMLLGAGLLKDFNNAFRFGIRKEGEESLIELKRAIEAVALVKKVTLTAGGFDLIFQLILILGMLSDPQTLGPCLAVGMLGLLYAFAFVLILLPLESRLKMKVQSMLQD